MNAGKQTLLKAHPKIDPGIAMAGTLTKHGPWLACVNNGVCDILPILPEGDLRQLPVTHVGWTNALA